MQIEQTIRQIAREEAAAVLSLVPDAEPDLVTIESIATDWKVNRATIDALVHDREVNGFPAVVLGAKTVRIDKTRLRAWLASGGLVETNGNVTPLRKVG